jgi:CheY-like chemotaxis protein
MRLLLVVEDDYDTRVTLSAVLAEAGYSVCDAGDAASALAKLRSLAPDVVLLDYGLPSPRDGEGFLRSKSMDAAIASTPVIVVSAYVLPATIDGTVAVIQKPFDVERLLEAIREAVGPPETPKTDAA